MTRIATPTISTRTVRRTYRAFPEKKPGATFVLGRRSGDAIDTADACFTKGRGSDFARMRPVTSVIAL
jgi:hypothetical protein